jgi:hypothetical protein
LGLRDGASGEVRLIGQPIHPPTHRHTLRRPAAAVEQVIVRGTTVISCTHILSDLERVALFWPVGRL